MPSPLQGFIWVFGMTVLFGILVGTLNLLNPDAVHIPYGVDSEGNPQSAEGMDGVIASTLYKCGFGIVFWSNSCDRRMVVQVWRKSREQLRIKTKQNLIEQGQFKP